MGGKVVGGTIETMVGRKRGVEGPRAEMVEVKLGLWEQVVPTVRREGDVGGREDGDEMIFGGTYGSTGQGAGEGGERGGGTAVVKVKDEAGLRETTDRV